MIQLEVILGSKKIEENVNFVDIVVKLKYADVYSVLVISIKLPKSTENKVIAVLNKSISTVLIVLAFVLYFVVLCDK